MDWVKRNLYFVIGSAVALVLMGLAGFYLYSGWKHKNEVFAKLSEQYTELKRLYDLDPNPGSEKVNNIKAAKEQQEVVRALIAEASKMFVAPPRIPNPEGTNRVTSEEFTSQLRRTIDQLQRDATNSSVTIPAKYNFSFEAQKSLMTFAPGSLDLLAVQLGEVKAICDILFAAKINALDNVRRERVSNDDYKGPGSDYLDVKSVTNELAVITPYEVTFRCFSAELAGVLNRLQSSPYCLLAKTVDVDPAAGGAVTPMEQGIAGEMAPDMAARYGLAAPQQPDMTAALQRRYGIGMNRPGAESPGAAPEAMARRYGIGGGDRYGGGQSLGGIQYRPLGGGQPGMPMVAPTPPPGYPATTPGAAPARGGLTPVLNEKPLRVILMIHVVKLLPKESNR